MASIFLVCKNAKYFKEAENLEKELIQSGHKVTYSAKSKVLRLFSKKFDVVHLIIDQLPMSIDEFLFCQMARALGVGIVVSLFGANKKITFYLALLKFQFQFIDAITVPQLSNLTGIREFKGFKLIFSGIYKSLKQKQNLIENFNEKKSDHLVIFPIKQKFEEIPEKINLIHDQMVLFKYKSKIKKSALNHKNWSRWVDENPKYFSVFFTREEKSIEQLAMDHRLVLVTSHLTLDVLEYHYFVGLATKYNMVWVANKNQASSLSQVWSKIDNRLIVGSDYTFCDGFHLHLEPFVLNDSQCNEHSMNEINRLYSRVLSSRYSLLQRVTDTVKS